MEKQVNFKQLVIAFAIAMMPTFYTIYNNSKSELKSKVNEHEIKLENHALRIQLLEKKSDGIDKKLDKIVDGVGDIKIELQNKQDKK